MKIRIHKDLVRLRLSQTEVENFKDSGVVNSSINFGSDSLEYQLISSASSDAVSAQFTNNCITIQVPESLASEWANTDRVGIENTDEEKIKILVEKDFKCLHKRPHIDDKDSFPNPSANN